MELTADDVATAWLKKWAGTSPQEVSIAEMDTDLDLGLPRNAPALCLASIVELLARIPANPEDRHFQLLAAGPLEDLLRNHGESVVDEVDSLARRDPSFRLLLNGAWAQSFSPLLQARLTKYLSSPW
jgi:hypothetical protein